MSMYLLVAITVACHLALSSKCERFRDDMVNEQELRPRNDVWSHTPRVCGSLSTPDVSVLSKSVMGLKQSFDRGWVGG